MKKKYLKLSATVLGVIFLVGAMFLNNAQVAVGARNVQEVVEIKPVEDALNDSDSVYQSQIDETPNEEYVASPYVE